MYNVVASGESTKSTDEFVFDGGSSMFSAEPKLADIKLDAHLPKPAPARTTASAAPAPRSNPFEASTDAANGTSVIGTDLTILGDRITIISKNKLQVDGDVRGNVHGKHVVITEEGSVVGMVSAETIEVRGGVRGSIRAVSVKLQSSAQVEGDITHQKLAIAEGAEFDGSVHLTKNASELMPVLDPEVIERERV
jgi:cytoskeletal protein CcmA (bactofilin family)